MIWNELARNYAGSRQISTDRLIEWPAQLRMAGDVRGLHMLDLGCGAGDKARFFAEQGALSVLAIDPSTGFAENWSSHSACRNLSFIRAGFEDLASLPQLKEKSFDLIVCFQALMYARSISETVQTMSGLLKDHGSFVLSVPHPFRFALLKSELEEWKPGAAYQHTAPYRYPSPWNPDMYLEHAMPRISDYLNALVQAGLHLAECDEPRVTEEFRNIAPEKAAWMDQYVGIMIFRAEKRSMEPARKDQPV